MNSSFIFNSPLFEIIFSFACRFFNTFILLLVICLIFIYIYKINGYNFLNNFIKNNNYSSSESDASSSFSASIAATTACDS